MLFIGGGFSALSDVSSAKERGLESILLWAWIRRRRYVVLELAPGAACDVVSYDYLPLLDELDYVPVNHYSRGPEFLATVRRSPKYNLYDLAVFNTTVTETAGTTRISFGM